MSARASPKATETSRAVIRCIRSVPGWTRLRIGGSKALKGLRQTRWLGLTDCLATRLSAAPVRAAGTRTQSPLTSLIQYVARPRWSARHGIGEHVLVAPYRIVKTNGLVLVQIADWQSPIPNWRLPFTQEASSPSMVSSGSASIPTALARRLQPGAKSLGWRSVFQPNLYACAWNLPPARAPAHHLTQFRAGVGARARAGLDCADAVAAWIA